MVGVDDIVITGLGCVTPIGIGRQDFQANLLAGKCAIREHLRLSDEAETTYYAALVDDFDGKLFVKPRKALKVMSREVQMAYSAAHLAWQDADFGDLSIDPERIGVVYGSEVIPGDQNELAAAVAACREEGVYDRGLWGKRFEKEIYPLWMLKNLPNMPACHVGIAVDARGPNNTIAQDEVSGLLALAEAAMVIQRGQTDVMVVGGVGNRTSPTRMSFRAWRLYDQHPHDDSANAELRCIPFADQTYGIVPSEGSAALVIESRRHAEARGAKILARVAAFSSRCGKPNSDYQGSWEAIASAADSVLKQADHRPDKLSHVCAQGFSEDVLDRNESRAIAEVFGETPVTAMSSYFGTAGAACGLMELTASLLGLLAGKRLAMHGHPGVGAAHPVNLCTKTEAAESNSFLKLSFTPFGHAAAALIECESQ